MGLHRDDNREVDVYSLSLSECLEYADELLDRAKAGIAEDQKLLVKWAATRSLDELVRIQDMYNKAVQEQFSHGDDCLEK